MIQRAFTPANYKASWGTHMPVLWQNLDEVKSQVIAVISAFFSLISGSEEEQEQAEEDLAISIKALVDKVNSSGVVGSGTHANGWICLCERRGQCDSGSAGHRVSTRSYHRRRKGSRYHQGRLHSDRRPPYRKSQAVVESRLADQVSGDLRCGVYSARFLQIDGD